MTYRLIVGLILSGVLFGQGGTVKYQTTIRPESGATMRTQQDKNEDVVSVKDFGAKGDGYTNDSSSIASALAHNNIVRMPPGTYVVNSSVVIPNKTRLIGSGRGDTGGANTTIKAGPSFPTNTPLIQLCSAPGPCFGVSAEDMTVDCNGVSGASGGYNAYSQEQSYFRRVALIGCPAKGLWLDVGIYATSAAQNSGPYEDLEVLPLTRGVAGTECVRATLVPSFRGLRDVTCNGDGYAGTEPTNAVIMDGTSGTVSDIHIEHFANGVLAGTTANSVSDITVQNVDGGPGVSTVIVIPGGVPTTHNVIILGAVASASGSTVIQDNCNSVTVDNSMGGGTYITGDGACGNQFLYSSRSDVTLKILTNLIVLKNLWVTGTGHNDGKVCFGLTTPALCLELHDTSSYDLLRTTTNGILLQTFGSTEGATGGGLWLNGGGYLNSAIFGAVGAGLTGDQGTFVARGPSASFVQFVGNSIDFFSNTGLTPGSTFSPRWTFHVDQDGARSLGTFTLGPGGCVASSGSAATPNGSVVGSPCDTYYSTSGGTATFWVKESGSASNTGWAAAAIPVTTTVGSPGVDTQVPTEKAVRTAINAASGGGPVSTLSLTGQTAGSGPYNLQSGGAVLPAHMYRVDCYATVNPAISISVSLTIGWTDERGNGYTSSYSVPNLGTFASFGAYSLMVHTDGTHDLTITYSATGTGTFDAFAAVSRLI